MKYTVVTSLVAVLTLSLAGCSGSPNVKSEGSIDATSIPTSTPSPADRPETSAGSEVVTAEFYDRQSLKSMKAANRSNYVVAVGKAPVRTQFRLNGLVPVAGKGSGRPVEVHERVNGSWKRVARAHANHNGNYRVKLKAGKKPRTRVFRSNAPTWRGLPAVRAANTSVKVTKKPKRRGKAVMNGKWATPEFLSAQEKREAVGRPRDWRYTNEKYGKWRWNPCQVIAWEYNPHGEAYKGAESDIRRAFARISGVSDLKFRYMGRFNKKVNIDLKALRHNRIRVGWGTTADLGGDPRMIGRAHVTAMIKRGQDGRISTASITLNRNSRLVAGFPPYNINGGPRAWGQVFQHEIAHTLGLGHATGVQQTMYHRSSSKNVRFGAGDLAGLKAIGGSNPCF